jgi:hypothetical protein
MESPSRATKPKTLTLNKEGLSMAIRVNKNQGSFKAKTIHIGIDIHKLSWRITAVADSEVVMACTMSRPTYNYIVPGRTKPKLCYYKTLIIFGALF